MAEAPVAQECVEGYLYVAAPLSLLLLRRPPARGRIWVPVSGKVEARDSDLPSALTRELFEETGFAGPLRPWALDWVVPFEGPDGRNWRLNAFGVELPARLLPSLSEEHDAYEWVSSVEARRRLHYEDNRRAVDRLLARLAPPPPPGRAGEGRPNTL